jgi:multiple sugar transport system ATP-binding protein
MAPRRFWTTCRSQWRSASSSPFSGLRAAESRPYFEFVAGLETADAGEVRLEGRRIDQLPPGQRGVAMVFQHYALYPHMSVRDNMAFGLRNVGVPKAEIESRVADAARVLEIEEHLDKKPGRCPGARGSGSRSAGRSSSIPNVPAR